MYDNCRRARAGPGVCVLVVEHGPLAPWAAGDDPDSTVVFKEGCTFNGKFELHVAGQHTRLAMEGCTAAGGGALGLRVTEAARADLKRVNFGEGSSGVAVADRRSHCTMHECSVALALEAVITVRHCLGLVVPWGRNTVLHGSCSTQMHANEKHCRAVGVLSGGSEAAPACAHVALHRTHAQACALSRTEFGLCQSGRSRRLPGHRAMTPRDIALTPRLCLQVRRRGRAVLSKCSITGHRCIMVSTEATLTVSQSTGICATGDFAVLVASRAVVDIAASTLSANPALESAAALVVRAGASAVASASMLTGASGVAATSSNLKMLQCGASGLDYAVRARAAHVHICDGCILHARGCAAVALEEGCNAVVTDSELHSTGHAALAAVASIVAAARNSMTLRASGRFCAGIVLNNLRNGSAFYGNTLQGTAEHALLQFVHAGQRDVAAVAAGGLLQHPRMSECDVLAERCAAHRTSDMLEDRERQDEVLWLRKLGARENRLEHNLSLAAATAGLLVGLPFDGMCALLRWVWKYLAVAGDFATHHIIEPMSQAASAATGLLATTAKTDVRRFPILNTRIHGFLYTRSIQSPCACLLHPQSAHCRS